MPMPRTRRLVLLIALLLCAVSLPAYLWWKDSEATLASIDATVRKDPRPPGCQKIPPSKLATRYLENLHGIEIGASTQNSFGLKRAINVDFSDEQGGLWQQKECAPAVVNIVAQGDDLPFKDSSLDYVVTSHVIEHFFDPVKALREWHRVIKPGGIIFIIAPHRDRTFDRSRAVTPLAELMDRSTGRINLTDYVKPLDDKEPERHKLLPGKGEPPPGYSRFHTDDHHHWSVWRTEDFVQLVKTLGMHIVEVQEVDDKVGNGFTVVIRKQK